MQRESLTDRRTQRGLLARACARHERARVAVRNGSQVVASAPAHLLELQADGLVLALPGPAAEALTPKDTGIQVTFADGAETYVFAARSIGEVGYTDPDGAVSTAWKLTLPLRIERARPAPAAPVRLPEASPIEVRFVDTQRPAAACAARLSDLSATGLTAELARGAGDWLCLGDILRATFRWPGEADAFDFVVRLREKRGVPLAGPRSIGCEFCGCDDATVWQRQVERIAALGRGATVAPGQSDPGDN